MNPGAYNNNVMLLQTPGMVVLHNEMLHEVRVVPLDRRQHLPARIPQLRGDSRGKPRIPRLIPAEGSRLPPGGQTTQDCDDTPAYQQA